MPVIGMMPMTIPTLTTSWNRIIAGHPGRRTSSRTGRATASPPTSTRHNEQDEQREQDHRADEPELLRQVAKTKSVAWTGRKSPWVWVPLVRPLPNNPPEPTAICDW